MQAKSYHFITLQLLMKTTILLWTSLLLSLAVPFPVRCNDAPFVNHTAKNLSKKPILFAMDIIGCDHYNRILDLVYREAFSRLGYSFAYTMYPLKRSLAGVNAGKVDGECGRFELSPAQIKKYPNLMQVNEPVWTAKLNAYSLRPDFQVDGWSSLEKYKNAVIGYIGGVLYPDQLKSRFPDFDLQLYQTLDTAQGLRMLVSKRIDLFLGFERPVQIALEKKEFSNLPIINSGPVENSMPLFPYLHKKHAGLVCPLADTLKQMKEDGPLAKIIQQVEQEIGGFPGREITLSTGFQAPLDKQESSFFNMASDIVIKAFAQKGYQVSFFYKTNREAYETAKKGQVDGTVFWRKTLAREKYFYISKPVISADIVFFHMKHTPFDWHSLEDLARFRAGIIRGLQYDNKFDMAVLLGNLPAETATSAKEIFTDLLSGKIDYAPTILESGYADLNKMFPPEVADLFTHHPKPLARPKFHLLLSRQDERNKIILSDFNQGLYLLKKSE